MIVANREIVDGIKKQEFKWISQIKPISDFWSGQELRMLYYSFLDNRGDFLPENSRNNVIADLVFDPLLDSHQASILFRL